MYKKHIENIRKYLDDLEETDTPWERWQFKYKEDEVWENLNHEPLWDKNAEYRRKPETIKKEISFLKPTTEELKPGEEYYAVEVYADKIQIFRSTWTNHHVDKCRLKEGRVHLSEEAAKTHLKALLNVFKPFEKKTS